MFDATIPVLDQFLNALSGILGKAEAHCTERKIEPDALLRARLFPDMFPLMRQVQTTCDFAKGAGARLAGVAVPAFADEETTFAELQARIAKTRDFLKTLTRQQFAAAATRTITMRFGREEMKWPGAEYLSMIALPNFYFHLTCAYAILRHNGVELGKRDFMG